MGECQIRQEKARPRYISPLWYGLTVKLSKLPPEDPSNKSERCVEAPFRGGSINLPACHSAELRRKSSLEVWQQSVEPQGRMCL